MITWGRADHMGEGHDHMRGGQITWGRDVITCKDMMFFS